MSLRRLIAIFVLGAIATIWALPALAQTAPVSVNANMARVLRLSSPAATVIVGNPGIADVTIQDPQTLILTGKAFGRTNLIVLDASGEPVADTLIEVVQLQADVVTIYQGQARTSVACAPICQQTVMLGDDVEYVNNSIATSRLIENAAR